MTDIISNGLDNGIYKQYSSRSDINLSDIQTLGFFGNIWVRVHYFKKKGDTNGEGHYHHFDHVTLLTKGSVLVEVEGFEAKKFTSPNFIIIKKDHSHKFTALEDDTTYFCVFALRDINGEVTEIYSGDNSPYGTIDTHKNLVNLDKLTTRVR